MTDEAKYLSLFSRFFFFQFFHVLRKSPLENRTMYYSETSSLNTTYNILLHDVCRMTFLVQISKNIGKQKIRRKKTHYCTPITLIIIYVFGLRLSKSQVPIQYCILGRLYIINSTTRLHVFGRKRKTGSDEYTDLRTDVGGFTMERLEEKKLWTTTVCIIITSHAQPVGCSYNIFGALNNTVQRITFALRRANKHYNVILCRRSHITDTYWNSPYGRICNIVHV